MLRCSAAAILLVAALAGCSTLGSHSAPAPKDARAAVAPAGGPDDGDGVSSFTLCAHGTYSSYAVLVERKQKVGAVQPGFCRTVPLGAANAGYRVEIYGLDAATPFLIGADTFTAGYDERIRTTGTVDKPDFFGF